MALITFLIILSVLVIVHELGHFSVAKYFGIRVDEFGLGYPPKAKKLFSWKGTDFTLNWLPFGGFVKIFGENYGEGVQEAAPGESFQNKNRAIQAGVLIAGVFGNFLFAWLLISLGFVTGLPAPVGLSFPVTNVETVVTLVVPNSPAALGGLKSGDTILSLERSGEKVPMSGEVLTPELASTFIAESESAVTLAIRRGQEAKKLLISPKNGLVEGRPAIGISMDSIGTVKLPIYKAITAGLKTTGDLTVVTAQSLGHFLKEAVIGKADLSSVAGPVGMVGIVSDVSKLGLGHLITFTALISINLCIINLLPFPALDGGRLLLVGLEAITRRQIPARIFNSLNTAGFALLIFLMILVTIHDVKGIL